MTRFLGTAGSVAQGAYRPLTSGQTSRIRRRKSSSISRSGSGSDAVDPSRPSVASSSIVASEESAPAIAAGGISTNRMWRDGKKKMDFTSSTKTGRLPLSCRRFVQRRPTSPGEGGSYRSASSGCSLLMCRIAFRITPSTVACAHRPVECPMVRSGVVEVDHQPDAATGHPDTDPDPVVLGVHQVDVVAAAIRSLALVEEMRCEHRRTGGTAPAADVLGPGVVRVAGVAEAIVRTAADEMAALAIDRQPLRVGP